jgi:hypothetical protein
MGASSIVSFQPTILKQLGWTTSQAQVHAIPVYLTGIAVSIGFSYASARVKLRWPFVIFGVCFAMTGWAIQLAQVPDPHVRYYGIFAIAIGSYVQMPLLVAWTNDNFRTMSARATGSALLYGFGNSANFISSNVFITKQAPRYPVGFGVGLALNIIGGLGVILLVALLKRANRLLDKKPSAQNLAEEQAHVGDFRYTI